jgi:hypothetical protein
MPYWEKALLQLKLGLRFSSSQFRFGLSQHVLSLLQVWTESEKGPGLYAKPYWEKALLQLKTRLVVLFFTVSGLD